MQTITNLKQCYGLFIHSVYVKARFQDLIFINKLVNTGINAFQYYFKKINEVYKFTLL